MQPSDFAALYRASVPYLRQLVFSITQNQQMVDDIIQDIYLAAWLRLRDDSHPNPMGWLMLTARHKAYDQLRRKIRETEHYLPLDLTSDTSVISLGLFTCDPQLDMVCEDSVPYGQMRLLLQQTELNLLLDYYHNGLSVDELAAKYHSSPSACRMKLHRAKKKLKPLVSLPDRRFSNDAPVKT